MLYTKLHRPPVTKEHVYRDHLIDLLDKNMYKPVTLVSAGAGYGKSMLISSWLEKCACPNSWISLNTDDDDLRTFLEYLEAGISRAIPDALKSFSKVISATELPPTKLIAEILINDLDEIPQDFIIVLDDFHLIRDSKIHELLNIFLEYPPQQIHLVIITRRDPLLNLNRIRANSRMNEIRMRELGFSREEIGQLFKNLIDIDLNSKTIGALHSKTEGWVTGLRLSSLSIKDAENAEGFLDNLSGNLHSISDYLIDEVLEQVGDEVRANLLRTSLLNRFCPEMIDQINIGIDGDGGSDKLGKEYIDWLIKSSLFIIPLDDRNEWFRYHHLFQEMLQNQLKKQYSIDEINAYHLKTSEWFESKGLLDEAIAHAHKANEEEKIIALIRRHRNAFLRKDQWYTAEKWQSNISDSTIEKTPELVLTKIWAAFHRAQMQDIFPLIGKLSKLLQDDEADEALLGELNWFNGLFAYFGNDAQKSIEYLEKAEKQLMPSNSHALGGAQVYLGFARLMAGLKEKAINEMNASLRSAKPGDYLYKCRLYSGIASVYYMAGDLVAALDPSEKLYQTGKDCNFDFSEGWGSWFLGGIYMRQGYFSKAEEMFLTAYEKRHSMGHDGAVDALIGLVLLYELTGQVEKSQNSLEKMKGFIDEIDNPSMLIKLKSCRARCALLREDVNSATSELFDQPITSSVPYLFAWIEILGFTKLRALIADGTDESLSNAQQWIKDIRKQTIPQHNACQDFEVAVLEVVLMEKLGKREHALNLLDQIIENGERNKWMFPFIEQGKSLKDLLAVLSDTSKNSKYIRLIMKAIDDIEVSQKKSIQTLVQNNTEQDALSFREVEILKLVAEGLRNKEIAEKLFISDGTIKKHIYNIGQKLETSSRIGSVRKAGEMGLIYSQI